MGNEQDKRYEEAIGTYGAALRRLSNGYEADPENREDLLQEIHIDLWLSLARFDGRCSLRTWVYRVAHNVAASHVMRSRRAAARLVDLEALTAEPVAADGEANAGGRHAFAKMLGMIHRLKPVDRQIILLYPPDQEAAEPAVEPGSKPCRKMTSKRARTRICGNPRRQGQCG